MATTHTTGVTSTTAMIQMLQNVSKLPDGPEMTPEQIRPVLRLDADQLLNTVSILWNTVRSQGTFLEVVEKEMAKRKTEVEIRMRNMHQELQDSLANDARRRQAENEKIHQELQSIKGGFETTRDELEKRCAALEDDLTKKFEKMTINTRMTMNETNTKLASTREDVSTLRSRMDGIGTTFAQHENENSHNFSKLTKDMDALHVLFSVTREDVQQANGTQRQKELLAGTAFFKQIIQRARDHDDAILGLRKEMTQHGVAFDTLRSRINELSDSVVQTKVDIGEAMKHQTEQSVIRDNVLGDRIDSLCRSLTSKGDNDSVSAQGLVRLETYVAAIDDTIKRLQDNVKTLMTGLKEKADETVVQGVAQKKADTEFVRTAVEQLQDRINGLGSLLDNARGKLEGDIEMLAQRGVGTGAAPTVTTIHRVDSGIRRGIDGLSDEVHSVQNILARLQQDINALDRDKIGRQELEECLASTLETLTNMQPQQGPTTQAAGLGDADGGPATSLRFRCLSCNRAAGPLVEKVRERFSIPQFPPSGLYIKGDTTSRRNPSPPSIMPGSRDRESGGANAGGSSRRKLLNYYDWLRALEEEKAAMKGGGKPQETSTDLVVVEVKSPRRVTLVEPHAIGTDGRYYVGVQDRPHSAPHL